jgi:hypothetical protein
MMNSAGSCSIPTRTDAWLCSRYVPRLLQEDPLKAKSLAHSKPRVTLARFSLFRTDKGAGLELKNLGPNPAVLYDFALSDNNWLANEYTPFYEYYDWSRGVYFVPL